MQFSWGIGMIVFFRSVLLFTFVLRQMHVDKAYLSAIFVLFIMTRKRNFVHCSSENEANMLISSQIHNEANQKHSENKCESPEMLIEFN